LNAKTGKRGETPSRRREVFVRSHEAATKIPVGKRKTVYYPQVKVDRST